jgi:site-specific DNA-methyltransferase (adenine-specific)
MLCGADEGQMMGEAFLNGKVTLLRGDCLELLPTLGEGSIDSCVTDPPYHLTSIVKRFGSPNAAECQHGTDGAYARASKGFMGKQWDGGDIAFRPELWAEVLRVLKPGAHLLAFSGTRTYHRMACAIEDAGFEIRDQIGWAYGSGFPKSHDVSKGIDATLLYGGANSRKMKQANDGREGEGRFRASTQNNGLMTDDMRGGRIIKDQPTTPKAEQWQGWGTALKPAWEPIVLARKPLSESSIAANVIKHGTGAINVDGCRIEAEPSHAKNWDSDKITDIRGGNFMRGKPGTLDNKKKNGIAAIGGSGHLSGRWPANLIHDGSEEVVSGFPETPGQLAAVGPRNGAKDSVNCYGDYGPRDQFNPRGDSGSAARFFYTAKADSDDRLGSKHPTVKPVDLIRYLVRLVTPPNGTVLDPFAGTGTTGEASFYEGFQAVLIEREEEYQADIVRRMGLCLAGPDERTRETIKASGKVEDAGPLFGGADASR